MFDRSRGRALRKAAGKRGWTYEKKGTWYSPYAAIPFSRGDECDAVNGVTGTHRGLPFRAFTFRHWDRDEDGTAYYSVITTPGPGHHPGVWIRRRNLIDKAATKLGRGAAGTGNAEFDKKWIATRSDDEAPVRITPGLQRVIEDAGRGHWTWKDNYLVFATTGSLNVKRLDHLVEQAAAFHRAASAGA